MKEKLPMANLDKFEIKSTLKFIKECKKDGTDCKALEEYIAPIIHSHRVNLDEEVSR
jgi:hypothetical protein